MSEKTVKTRIQLKYDTEAHWNLAVNFIPKLGEIILYAPDANNPLVRMKVGDGVTKVTQLKFSSGVPDWNQADSSAPDFVKNKPTIISSSKSEAEDGTELSLVTTGEKYVWNQNSATAITSAEIDEIFV